MSKQIDFEQPLSEEDTAYVLQREWMLRDAKLAGHTVILHGEESPEDGDEPESDDQNEEDGEEEIDYNDLKVDELNAEIDARNEEKDEDEQIVPESSKKADLIAALVADDEAAASE